MNAAHMVPELTLIFSKWKLVAASGVAIVCTFADAVVPPEARWEHLTLTGALVAAVIYLVRELAKERESDKAANKDREDKLSAALNANTAAMQANSERLAEQTKYLEAVAGKIISKQLDGASNLPSTVILPPKQ